MNPTRATANKFLNSHNTAILATIDSNGNPSATPIHYVLSLKNSILFVTGNKTSKYQNLSSSNKAALCVVDGNRPISVNIVGEVSTVTDEEEIRSTFTKIGHTKTGKDYPPATKHLRGDFVVLELIPKHIQYCDYSNNRDTSGQYIFDL
jgi:uncharacterized pyridoxamine 5'-phosphate oxidase family protein